MRLTLSLVAAAGLFTLAPGAAQATCLLSCEVAPTDAACSPAGEVSYTTEDMIYAHGACSVTCCAPPDPEHPEGNCSTSAEPLTPDMLKIWEESGNQPLPGAFVATGQRCGTDALLMFDRTLDAGSYWIAQDNLLIAPFEVEEATGGCGARTTNAPTTGAALLAALGLLLVRRRR